MASVNECIEKMAASGQISRALADEAKGLFERSQAEFSMHSGPASADAAAAVTVAKQLRERAAARQLQIATTVKAYQLGERRILEDPRGRRFALAGMLTDDASIGTTKLDALRKSDPTHPIFSGGNVNMRARATSKQLFAMMGADLNKFGTGVRTNARLIELSKNFIRERFGVSTGDALSKRLSDAFGKVVDYAAARAKAAGRVFKELEDWRVSQPWTPDRVRQFDANEFVKDFRSEIANGGLKLFGKETGVYAAAGKHDEILRRAYSDIKTEGSTNAPFSREMRTFQFQPGQLGADAWLRLQGKYGVGNEIMATVVNHIEGMAGEIALHSPRSGSARTGLPPWCAWPWIRRSHDAFVAHHCLFTAEGDWSGSRCGMGNIRRGHVPDVEEATRASEHLASLVRRADRVGKIRYYPSRTQKFTPMTRQCR